MNRKVDELYKEGKIELNCAQFNLEKYSMSSCIYNTGLWRVKVIGKHNELLKIAGENSPRGIFQRVIFLWGNFPEGSFFREGIFQWGIFLRREVSGGEFSREEFD